MKDIYADLIAFHRRYGHFVGDRPAVPDMVTVEFRRRLIFEEVAELMDAIALDDLPGVAKEAIDTVYVVVGLLIACGIDPRPIWDAVHASNMTKSQNIRREDGKVLKGPRYRPADIVGMLARQGPLHARPEPSASEVKS